MPQRHGLNGQMTKNTTNKAP